MSSPDEDNMTLEEKCEVLLDEVVNLRKAYRKYCVEQQQKTSVIENKMLQLQIQKIESTRLKQNLPANVDVEKILNDHKKFMQHLREHDQRKDSLAKDVLNVKQVLMQMKDCAISKKISTYQKQFSNDENIGNEPKIDNHELKIKKEKKRNKNSKIGISDQGKNTVTVDKIQQEKFKSKKDNKKLRDIKNCIEIMEE